MKLATLWLVMCVMGWGQQQPKSLPPCGPTSDGWCIQNQQRSCIPTAIGRVCADASPAPLKCEKYEHYEPGSIEDCSDGLGSCRTNVPARCAPDIHTLTEKDWQELMAQNRARDARLKALEGKLFYGEWPVTTGSYATDCKTPSDDPKKPCDKNQPSQKALEHKDKP